jgi:hypothetical protein
VGLPQKGIDDAFQHSPPRARTLLRQVGQQLIRQFHFTHRWWARYFIQRTPHPNYASIKPCCTPGYLLAQPQNCSCSYSVGVYLIIYCKSKIITPCTVLYAIAVRYKLRCGVVLFCRTPISQQSPLFSRLILPTLLFLVTFSEALKIRKWHQHSAYEIAASNRSWRCNNLKLHPSSRVNTPRKNGSERADSVE